MQDPENKRLSTERLRFWRKPHVSVMDPMQLQGPGGLGTRRSWSRKGEVCLFPSRRCVLCMSVGRSQKCPLHRSFWHPSGNTGVFKAKCLFQNHLPPAKPPQPSPPSARCFQIALRVCSHPAWGWWHSGFPPQSQEAAAHLGEPTPSWWTSGSLSCSFLGLLGSCRIHVTSPPLWESNSAN